MSDAAASLDADQHTVADTHLSFEREKWLAECEFRRRELELKAQEQDRQRSELQFKIAEAKRSRWTNPLVLAIIAAALAAVGNGAVSWINSNSAQDIQDANNKATLNVETFKAESSRILEAIRTGDPDKAAVNLKFLLDTRLVTNRETVEYLKTFLANRSSGQGPALPASAPSDNQLPSTCSFDPTQLSAKELVERFEGQAIDEPEFNKLVTRIRDATNNQLTDNQVSALASLAYNIGFSNVERSSIFRFIKGNDLRKAGDAFLVWDKMAGGGSQPGLHLRRLCERDLFTAQTQGSTAPTSKH